MSESDAGAGGKRGRSPPFPYIGITKALERTAQLFAKAKRSEVRISDAAVDWGLSPKSSGPLQTVGALLAYGLIEASGSGDARKIKISEAGWRILEDTRSGVKERLLSEAALKPKIIREYAALWGKGRPDDHHSISQLKFDSMLTHEGAVTFLRVFDDAMQFAGELPTEVTSDEASEVNAASALPAQPATVAKREVQIIDPSAKLQPPPPSFPPPQRTQQGIQLMANERELTTGILSKAGASFRLIVQGTIGERELDRLIRKLQLDKEILADQDDTEQSDGVG